MTIASTIPLQVPVKRLPHAQDLDLPHYATPHSAGMDLVAALASPITLAPGARALIPTGFALLCPLDLKRRSGPVRALRQNVALRCSILRVPLTRIIGVK
ncbi:hypothetical protein JCM17845_13640 [Iodidimonas gelatinilytica]|uniref:dUTP diphosphatase n=1 Tax=Iodidimonas gelatinilytica TaxID=1236966 RepID=A0A5A7MXD2_9PROT|nr:hypothetical protein [Iodidimonas gelatinilytica]GER00741.1 hypothetical protein JCM17845_13640 [Iodidimonas gelatinilytica]